VTDAPTDPTSRGERRLLVVGREVEALSHLADALCARGYSVATCAPGEEAFARIEQHQPELVAVDVVKGVGDPLAELVRIKEALGSEVFRPVIAIFPAKAPADIVRGFRSGADDFLIRPFDPFELVLRLEVLWRIKSLQDEILSTNQRLHELSITDDLTGLCNQGEFRRRMEIELRRVRRFNSPLSVMFFDGDRFKRVNDVHGHAAGTMVIKEIARILVSQLRETDILCRYGGDEFVVGLPACDLASAYEVADRLRQVVSISPFQFGDDEIYITLSLGVASSTPAMPLTLDALLAQADTALYKAKNTGRNRVCLPPLPEEDTVEEIPDDRDAPLDAERTETDEAPSGGVPQVPDDGEEPTPGEAAAGAQRTREQTEDTDQEEGEPK
jgi:diguanylate cyclase (GGDEF)-like protein